MPRRARHAPGGLIYHVLNRAVGRMRLFTRPADFAAFEQVLRDALQHHPIRLLGYCVMPNHWHLVVWPQRDGELSRFMHWLTMTHTQRWRHHRGLVGLGPLYQGRFKAFPTQDDTHLLGVLRYVERNALRAGLVSRAQTWPYCSLYHRSSPRSSMHTLLHPWPIDVPRYYLELVNQPQTAREEHDVRTCVRRGRPFGAPEWQLQVIRQLHLQSSVRAAHRPRKFAAHAM
jgi:putative transposase